MIIESDNRFLLKEIYAKPFYDGLFLIGGEIYVRTGCYYLGQRITALNKLHGTAEMVLASIQMEESLNEETEVRPLVDLVFANIARECGLVFGKGKTISKFLNQGLKELEARELVPRGCRRGIKKLLNKHKELWPKETQPLLTQYHRLMARNNGFRYLSCG